MISPGLVSVALGNKKHMQEEGVDFLRCVAKQGHSQGVSFALAWKARVDPAR